MQLSNSLSLTSPIMRQARDRSAILGNKPKTVANFARNYYRANGVTTTFADMFTFTRPSSATYFDASGNLQTAASGQPRIGAHVWDGSAWVNKGCRFESEARTNLLTYSDDLSNLSWTKAAGVTIGAPLSSHGIKLDLIQNTGATNFRAVWKSLGAVPNAGYVVFSCYIKAGSSPLTAIRLDDVGIGATTNRCTIPIAWAAGVPTRLAVVTSGLTYVSSQIEQVGSDGLYRVSLVVQNATGASLSLFGSYYASWDGPIAAETTYAGGFQAELASTRSSYIPTAGAQATRAGETLTIPAARMSYDATAMWITMKGLVTYADLGVNDNVIFFRWTMDGNNRINYGINTVGSDTGKFTISQFSGGVVDYSSPATQLTPGVDVPFSLAGRDGSSFVQAALNGVAGTADITPTALPALGSTDMGLAYIFNGYLTEYRQGIGDIGSAGIIAGSAA